MNGISLFLSVIAALIIILALRQINSNFTVPAVIILSVLIVHTTLNRASDVFTFLESYVSQSSLGLYSKTLLKVFGVSLAAETTADICKEANFPSLASKVELVAKTELIILSLPIIEEILNFTKNMFL